MLRKGCSGREGMLRMGSDARDEKGCSGWEGMLRMGRDARDGKGCSGRDGKGCSGRDAQDGKGCSGWEAMLGMGRDAQDGKQCSGWEGMLGMGRDARDGKRCSGWEGMLRMGSDARDGRGYSGCRRSSAPEHPSAITRGRAAPQSCAPKPPGRSPRRAITVASPPVPAEPAAPGCMRECSSFPGRWRQDGSSSPSPLSLWGLTGTGHCWGHWALLGTTDPGQLSVPGEIPRGILPPTVC